MDFLTVKLWRVTTKNQRMLSKERMRISAASGSNIGHTQQRERVGECVATLDAIQNQGLL
jgi:hypothetical protein